MHISNSLAGQSLEDVHIALQFFDANNNAIAATADPNDGNARFFWRTDRSDGISSLDGGLIQPQSAAHIQWLIIPAAGSGGSQSQGAIYYIGAKVRYRLDGQDIEVDVEPEAIIVRPLPQLVLDYFLPKDVAGDDPFTPEIEPSEPFTLGVRIRNDGGGTSHNTRIDTAQPQIVENRQGLAVNFQILSGFVGDEAAGKTLLLNFGDIAPGTAQTGRWNMTASLAGQFVEFNATFTHADALGGALTSLIRQVNTHELIHDVLVELPGRDTLRGFLAKDGDTYRVYESDGRDTAVLERSAGAQLRAATAGGAARLTFAPPAATPVYVRVPDPWQGSRQATRVVRSDGHVLPAANAWFSRTRNEQQGWDYWFHIFDADSSGDYTLEIAPITAQASLRGEVFEDRNGNGLREAGEPGLAVQEVKLRGTRAADGQTILASAHTDSRGEFHFDTLAPGIYALNVGPAQGLVDGAVLAGTAGGQILPGQSASITRIVLAGGAAASGYTFAKRATSTPTAGAQPASADLSVAATAQPARITRAGHTTLTITARNNGPQQASAAAVRLQLPAALRPQNHNASAGNFSDDIWTLGNLAPNTEQTLTLRLHHDDAASTGQRSFPVVARIGASSADPQPANNSASVQIILGEADSGISATQTLDPGLRVLLYADCGTDTVCTDEKTQAVQRLLPPQDASAQITTTPAAFEHALHTGHFSVIWLSGSSAALPQALHEQIWAAVYRGAALLIEAETGPLPATWADLCPGACLDAPIDAGTTLQLGTAALPLPASVHAAARSLRAQDNQTLLRYSTSAPAALQTRLGDGRVLLLGFDALHPAWTDPAWTAWLQAHVHTLPTAPWAAATTPMLAGSIVRLHSSITNHSAAMQALLQTSTLPAGWSLHSARPATAVQGDTAQWALDTAAGQTQTVAAWLQLPASSGNSAITTELHARDTNTLLDAWTHSVQILALPEAMHQARSAIVAVTQLSPTQRQSLDDWMLAAQQAGQAVPPDLVQTLDALVQAQQLLRALPASSSGKEAALHALSRWIGLVGMQTSAATPPPAPPTAPLQPTPYTLAVLQGANQRALVNTAYAHPVQVRLRDAQGQAVPGYAVDFILPQIAGSAGAGFAAGGTTAPGVTRVQIVTDAQGIATSPQLLANAHPGAFVLEVSAAAVLNGLHIALENLPANQPPPPNPPPSGTPGSGRHVTLSTPTGTGTVTASFTGGGASCRFDPDKTAVRRAEGWLPLGKLLFPHGVLDFELTGCDVGSTVHITTEWPSVQGLNSYLKYGPTPTSGGRKIWYVPQALQANGARFTYTITDGQLGDDDLQANGRIKDPSGPGGLGGTSIPALGMPGLALLGALLAVGAWLFGGWQSMRRSGSLLTLALLVLPLCLAINAPAIADEAGIDTGLRGDDRVTGKLPIGFEFDYFGRKYTDFYVSTNGLFSFDSPSTQYSNACLPQGHLGDTIMVYWDDLRTDAPGQVEGRIHYQTLGQAPDRKLVVQWTNMYFYGSNLPMGSFQLVLHEGSQHISFQYRYLLDSRSSGALATIGIQGKNGEALEIGCNTPDAIEAAQGYHFVPAASGGYDLQEGPYLFEDISGLRLAAPQADKLLTNEAAHWSWQAQGTLNSYQVQVYDGSGATLLHEESVGGATTFAWPQQALVHAQNLRLRVRGSINDGGTWEEWSEFSEPVLIDLHSPALASALVQTDVGRATLRWQVEDADSGLAAADAWLTVSHDPGYANPLLDRAIPLQDGTQRHSDEIAFDYSAQGQQLFVRLRFSDRAGNRVQSEEVFDILLPPQIQQPAANATLSQADMAVAGSAVNSETVDIFLNDQPVHTAVPVDADGGFAATIALPAPGVHTLHVVGASGPSRSGAGPQVSIIFAPPPTTLSVRFDSQPLDANTTIIRAGELALTLENPAGITSVGASLNGKPLFEHTHTNVTPVNHSQFLDFAQVPDGAAQLHIRTRDAWGQEVTWDIPFTLSIPAPAVPVIISPRHDARVDGAQLAVSGTAAPGAQVQAYLDGQAAGSPVMVQADGSFSTRITLPAEGSYQLSATASNTRGSSASTAPVTIHYATALPAVAFIQPADAAQISGDTTLSVLASDPAGIRQVDFYANDQLIGTVSQAPWRVLWNTAALPEGSYTLKATATNMAGKSAQAVHTVTLRHHSAPSDPSRPANPPGTGASAPATPYTGAITATSPALSYGEQPIVMSGTALARDSGQAVPHAPLRLLLEATGFARSIQIVTDANGQFHYEFVPAANDSGSYSVSALHPEEDSTAAGQNPQADFTINRLGFDLQNYQLSAAYGIPATITLHARASAGSGVAGVHWVPDPASVPPGITVDTGTPIDIPAEATVPMLLRFTGQASAPASGTIHLTAHAQDSAAAPRARFALHYRLVPAQSALFAEPDAIHTGVQQGSSVSESIAIGNRGQAPAQQVQLQLLADNGSAAAPWLFLSSAAQLGALDVGAQESVQITARPGSDVANGIYRFQLQVSSGQQQVGTVPITVAVTQSGAGGIRFHTTDLFTATPDSSGNPIPGLADVRIRLQNEAVPSLMHTLTTDAQGLAQIDTLPPGAYLYHASGPQHEEKSGRIFVRPGITIEQPVHLHYQSVQISFSVSETSIADEYHINLEATFQTQVPAPVVLLEPASINLPAMQAGEHITGELTLTNYGLIAAQNVQFEPPQTNAAYRYEFLAEVPKTLEARQRVVIPYRITALVNNFKSSRNASVVPKISGLREFLDKADSGGQCSYYFEKITTKYKVICPNGEIENRTETAWFIRQAGTNCSTSSAVGSGWGSGGYGGGGGWGGWGGGWLGGGTLLPGLPICTPTSRSGRCGEPGTGPGAK